MKNIAINKWSDLLNIDDLIKNYNLEFPNKKNTYQVKNTV
jgi:hypothetical protein